MCLAKPVTTRGLTGMGPGLAGQEAAGQVFGVVGNQTKPFLRFEPGPLAGYPDPLLTLVKAIQSTPMLVEPLHPEHWEVYTVTEEEDECEPAPVASKIVFDSAFKQLNSPANVYIY